MIFVDTTELKRRIQRQLHAAWWELQGKQVLAPPAVALELAPQGAGSARHGRESEAERDLRLDSEKLDVDEVQNLKVQAWWAQQWREPKGPYRIAVPNREQRQLETEILKTIDYRCFPATDALRFDREMGDPRIVAQTLAMGAQMLLTSDRKSMNRNRINEWAIANGDRLGFPARDVLFQVDEVFMQWIRKPEGRERWIQAGFIACWPRRDDADAWQVIDETRSAVERMGAGTGGKLPAAAEQLVKDLIDHPDPVGLVKRTRAGFPSPTIEAERRHPTYSR